MVKAESIIGIFDLDGEVTTPATKEFLRRAESEGKTSLAGDDLPRSFVLTDDEVVFSRLTSQTLADRAES